MNSDNPRLKNILFVDDESLVLTGLENMLRKLRHEWDMTFVASGREALELMKQKHFDIIISDMRMPKMDGVQLLNMVKSLYPGTVRFILSGHADRDMILRSVGSTHQFLSKPCDADALKAAVSRAFSLRDLLGSEKLAHLVFDMKAIPAIPELYEKVCMILNTPDCSIAAVSKIISRDVAMTAKILQLVNSAFFGLRRRVESVEQAAALLGLDTIKSVILTANVFDKFSENEMLTFGIHDLYMHCTHVGNIAQRVAIRLQLDKKLVDETMMAGMMHDLGKIVLIRTHQDAYREIHKQARRDARALVDVEQECLGVSHAEVGAYVLGLWGMTDSIVEAVAFHHAPSHCLVQTVNVMTAVHLANVFAHSTAAVDTGPEPEIPDKAYLMSLGLEERMAELSVLAVMPERGPQEE